MLLFNEVMTSFYLYLKLCLTDFHGDESMRDEIGWALLILFIFTITVNLIKVTVVNFVRFKILCKRFGAKVRQKMNFKFDVA